MYQLMEITNSEVKSSTWTCGKDDNLRRENVGYIFQFFNLISDLTAEENVLLVQQLSGLNDREEQRKCSPSRIIWA